MQKGNKSKIIILGVMPILALIIGFTLSYYLSNHLVNNDFKSTVYGATLVKECDAPDKWWAGDSYTCEISGRNESDIDVALRIIVYPEWVDKYNTEIESTFTYYVYNEETDNYDGITEDYAQIHFVNSNDWIEDGAWSDYGKVYYYKNKLSKNEVTSLLTDSVTYNINSPKSNCQSTNAISQSGSGTGNSGTTSGNGNNIPEYKARAYNTQCTDNDRNHGNFRLKFYIETVQYDAYREVWETDVTIN